MEWKNTFAKIILYSVFIALFVIFYAKDLMSDFVKGRSTITSQYQTIQSIEFPTVTICMTPGFKSSVLQKYGIKRGSDVLKKEFNQTISKIFNEISYIIEKDYDILDVTTRKRLQYNSEPIFTYHHGTCQKFQPISSITKLPQYLNMQIVLKSMLDVDKPKGANVYLTSNKTWYNVALERWPQFNPTKFFMEFTDSGLIKGMKLKLTEHIFDESNSDIPDCHTKLMLTHFNCSIKCHFLSISSSPPCNKTEDQKCVWANRFKVPHQFENCFKIKQFLTYKAVTYDFPTNPPSNSSTIQFFMSIHDLSKEVREEVKVISIESLIGSLGGSVGMFFGFSFTSTLLYLISKCNLSERLKFRLTRHSSLK